LEREVDEGTVGEELGWAAPSEVRVPSSSAPLKSRGVVYIAG